MLVTQRTPPFFGFEILKAGWLPHRWLFREETENALEGGVYPGAHIYYLTRTKKLRFIPESAEITQEGGLRVGIRTTSNHVIFASTPILSLPHFSNYGFTDVAEFSPRVDRAGSTGFDISVSAQIHDESLTAPVLPIEYLIAAGHFDFGCPPEILYIGQSFDMLKRWRGHEHVNRALSMLGDDEELRLYYVHFNFLAEFASYGDARWNALLETSDRNTKSFRDRISVLEQALIQFYRPKLNSLLVNGGVDTAPYTRVIEATGIKGIGMGLGMDGPAFQFWSPDQCLKSEVVTLIDEQGLPTFHEGLIEIESLFE